MQLLAGNRVIGILEIRWRGGGKRTRFGAKAHHDLPMLEELAVHIATAINTLRLLSDRATAALRAKRADNALAAIGISMRMKAHDLVKGVTVQEAVLNMLLDKNGVLLTNNGRF